MWLSAWYGPPRRSEYACWTLGWIRGLSIIKIATPRRAPRVYNFAGASTHRHNLTERDPCRSDTGENGVGANLHLVQDFSRTDNTKGRPIGLANSIVKEAAALMAPAFLHFSYCAPMHVHIGKSAERRSNPAAAATPIVPEWLVSVGTTLNSHHDRKPTCKEHWTFNPRKLRWHHDIV